MYEELTEDEFNRMWPVIHGNLSSKEKMFWAKTAALNIEVSERRAALEEGHKQAWRVLAYFFGLVSLVLVVVLASRGL